MAAVKLTKTFIDSLKPDPARQYTVYDTVVTGLHVVVSPSGTKTYYLYYRNRVGRGRNLKLGRCTIITLVQAREMAKSELYAVLRGEDPSRDRADAKNAPTIAEACDWFMEQHVKPKLKPRTREEYGRIIDKRIKPRFGSMKVGEVTTDQVHGWHVGMASTPREANHALAVLSKIMTLMINVRKLRNDNPCTGIERYPETKRERFLSDSEFSKLGDALAKAEKEERGNPYLISAIRLLCFTGCRVNEVLTLRWSDVDFETRCLHLPDSKTGAKAVHLGAPALKILAGIPRLPEVPWVFPGADLEKPLRNIHHAWHRIRDRAGLAGVRLHDLRHSFASVGVKGGLGLPIIGKVLGQSQLATTERYSHLESDPIKRAVEGISSHIAGAMLNKKADVVILRTRKN